MKVQISNWKEGKKILYGLQRVVERDTECPYVDYALRVSVESETLPEVSKRNRNIQLGYLEGIRSTDFVEEKSHAWWEDGSFLTIPIISSSSLDPTEEQVVALEEFHDELWKSNGSRLSKEEMSTKLNTFGNFENEILKKYFLITHCWAEHHNVPYATLGLENIKADLHLVRFRDKQYERQGSFLLATHKKDKKPEIANNTLMFPMRNTFYEPIERDLFEPYKQGRPSDLGPNVLIGIESRIKEGKVELEILKSGEYQGIRAYICSSSSMHLRNNPYETRGASPFYNNRIVPDNLGERLSFYR